MFIVWLLLWCILLAPFLFILYMEVKNRRKIIITNRLPGPPTIPVLGNAHMMAKSASAILSQMMNWWVEYGKTNYRLHIGYYRNFIITEPKDLEYILSSNTLLEKSDVYTMLHPWLGTGLLTSHGRKWHKHRKMITPSFHFKILQNFHEVMNENSSKFIEKLREVSAGETIFDFQDMTHYLTLDVICDTAMGVQINAMDNRDAEIVRAFQYMCENINLRVYHPIKRNNTFYKFAPDYPEFCNALKILQNFTNNVIQNRIEARERDAKEGALHSENDEFSRKKLAFLDTLLSSTIDGRPLTREEVYEEVSTFMFEGHDTTTSGIAFSIYLLSRHLDIQEKVYAEQKDIMGANLKGDATFQQMAEMSYLDMFIKESLRLYPSVPLVGRRTEKDYDINGLLIPEDSPISLFLFALGYNEKYFPDPHRCDPERFNPNNRTTQLNPFEYLPFSAGPRNCIGQKFALLEIKTVVSKVVRNFQILPPLDELASKDGYIRHFLGLSLDEQKKRYPNPNKYDPILSAVLTLKSENGVALRLRERS